MQAVPNKLNRRGGSPNKLILRTRHISINTCLHPGSLGTRLEQARNAFSQSQSRAGMLNGDSNKPLSTFPISEASGDLTPPHVNWLDVNDDSATQGEDVEDIEAGQMRPRCKSESDASKKSGAYSRSHDSIDESQA